MLHLQVDGNSYQTWEDEDSNFDFFLNHILTSFTNINRFQQAAATIGHQVASRTFTFFHYSAKLNLSRFAKTGYAQ